MQVTGNNIQQNSKSIRFSTGGLSLCSSRECKSFAFDKMDENFYKSMATILCEDICSSCIWDIYIDSPYYTIIPKEIGNKEICISAFKLNFPEVNANHLIMSQDIDRHDMICIFGTNKSLYNFITTHIPLHKIHHYSSISLVKAIEQSKNSGTSQMWAKQSNNYLYIHLVENGKLLLSNSFNIKKPTDTLYYVGSIFEQFSLPTKTTELYFSGEEEHYNLLKKHISLTNNISEQCEL